MSGAMTLYWSEQQMAGHSASWLSLMNLHGSVYLSMQLEGSGHRMFLTSSTIYSLAEEYQSISDLTKVILSRATLNDFQYRTLEGFLKCSDEKIERFDGYDI